MTTAAVMLVKDEADVIEHTIRHLREQVDHVYVADNESTDGTLEIIQALSNEGLGVTWTVDREVAYEQSRKTTSLAFLALEEGYDWVVPCDADEWWYSPFGRVGDVLAGLDGGALFATAVILNHITTGHDDPADANPVTRIGWRLDEFGRLPKVACRANAQLWIGMGNHEATSVGQVHSAHGPTVTDQLYIHHYPWRSEQQFLSKITNGARAYAAAPEIGPEFGSHWRQFGMPEDEGFEERVCGWFREWGYRADPWATDHPGGALVYHPAGT